jgi:hypothetical protein
MIGTIHTLLQQNQLLQARELAEHWLNSAPENIELAHQYAGMAQIFCGDVLDAERNFRAAIAINPESPRNIANLSIALLTQGRYTEGLPLYEFRYKQDATQANRVDFAIKNDPRQWRGESLTGKRLLLVGEQGYGDHFQFIRFAAELSVLGTSHISVFSRPELQQILASAPCIDQVMFEPPPPEDYDLWTPMLSTLLHLHIRAPQEPSCLPYLFANPEKETRWHHQLQQWAGNKPKIGIVWAGSPGNSIDARRSLRTNQMLSLVKHCPFASFFSLQLGDAGFDQLPEQCSLGIIPLLDLLDDFSDTAAAIACLDLVISVDTAVAHLSAAMGKPTYLLLPTGADWRWGQHLSSTAWYPSIKIFRQTTPGNWEPVIQHVTQDLIESLQ